MPKSKKDTHSFSIRLDKSINNRLEEFCFHSGQSKTKAIERAITMYIDDYDEKQKIINKNI